MLLQGILQFYNSGPIIISISVFGSFLPKIIVSYVSITLRATSQTHSVNHVVRIIGNPASLSTYLLLVVGIVDEDKQGDLHQEFFDVVLL